MIPEWYAHEGRPFAEWLLQLVDDASAKRREASRVITDRFYMPQESLLQPGVDTNQLVAEFSDAVSEAVRQPDFPAAEYVRKLFTVSMALEAARMGAWRAKQKDDDKWHEAQHQKLGENPSAAEVQRYFKRAGVRLRRECQNLGSAPDEAFETGMAIAYVIGALGEELLPAAELMRHMIHETHQQYLVSSAICRMGRAAIEFYPDLLRGFERDDFNGYFTKPLGHLLRAVPGKVPEILQFVSSDNPKVRVNAINTFAHCGRAGLKSFPEVEATLLARIRECGDYEWFACANALGEVATRSEAVTVMLEATYPATREHAAAAITSLGQMGLEPERVVPRLVTLLEDFKEPDPDWTYNGDNARVVLSLRTFGAHAAPAIPSLLERVWTKPVSYYDADHQIKERPEPDRSVIELLGDLAPASAAALPLLNAMKGELIRRCVEDRVSSEEIGGTEMFDEESCCPEFLLEAVAKLTHAPS